MSVRVAIDATPLLGQPTGVGTFVAGALEALARRPRDVSMTAYGLTWNGRHELAGFLAPGVRRGRPLMAAAPLLRLWERFDGPTIEWWTGPVDVVHGTNYVVPPTRGRRAARVVSVYDLTALHYPELCDSTSLRYPALIRRAVDEGAWVHTTAEFVADEVREWLGVDPERVVTVVPGIDRLEASFISHAGASLPKEPRTILALATSEPRKDLVTLVEAFDAIASDRPDIRLVMAGRKGWAEAEVAAAVAAARHGDRIERPGWVDPNRHARLLCTATVFAYPSRYEGFGFPPLEAMAFGVPVVASAAGAVPETVGDAACLVPVGDAEAMASSLAALLDDDQLRADLIERGHHRVAAFTWERCADGLIDLYRRAAANR